MYRQTCRNHHKQPWIERQTCTRQSHRRELIFCLIRYTQPKENTFGLRYVSPLVTWQGLGEWTKKHNCSSNRIDISCTYILKHRKTSLCNSHIILKNVERPDCEADQGYKLDEYKNYIAKKCNNPSTVYHRCRKCGNSVIIVQTVQLVSMHQWHDACQQPTCNTFQTVDKKNALMCKVLFMAVSGVSPKAWRSAGTPHYFAMAPCFAIYTRILTYIL